MQLVETYLWADRLCIDQNYELDKKVQIY